MPEQHQVNGEHLRSDSPTESLATLLRSSPEATARLMAQAFGPVLALPDRDQRELVQTLAVWFGAGRSAARAAAGLHCHRNTVRHRLLRLEAMLGRPIRPSADLLDLDLEVAVRAARALGLPAVRAAVGNAPAVASAG